MVARSCKGNTHVSSDKVDLGVTVLAGLGGGHVDDLARPALDDDVTVLAESGTLHAGIRILQSEILG